MNEPQRPASPDVGGRRGPGRDQARRPDWAVRFLEVFAATGNVRLSAGAAGVSRDAPYKRAKSDQAFAARWAASREDAMDSLAGEARRRALAGSDRLLMFLLRALRPEVYRDNWIDVRAVAERMAKAEGLDADEVIAEAERLVAKYCR